MQSCPALEKVAGRPGGGAQIWAGARVGDAAVMAAGWDLFAVRASGEAEPLPALPDRVRQVASVFGLASGNVAVFVRDERRPEILAQDGPGWRSLPLPAGTHAVLDLDPTRGVALLASSDPNVYRVWSLALQPSAAPVEVLSIARPDVVWAGAVAGDTVYVATSEAHHRIEGNAAPVRLPGPSLGCLRWLGGELLGCLAAGIAPDLPHAAVRSADRGRTWRGLFDWRADQPACLTGACAIAAHDHADGGADAVSGDAAHGNHADAGGAHAPRTTGGGGCSCSTADATPQAVPTIVLLAWAAGRRWRRARSVRRRRLDPEPDRPRRVA